MSKDNNDIDESLYSRQLYVMGHEAQRKMALSNVLIIGLNGLGIEVAKNVILAGVKSVTLFDYKNTTYSDLSSQFYLNENSINYNRAKESLNKLSELNPYVSINILNNEPTNDYIKDNYNVVVLIDVTLEKQKCIANFCHSVGISVVIGDVFGVFGHIFCDFGENFSVHDINGEPAASSMVASITLDTNPIVTVLEDTRHNLETGDVIIFTDIVGMNELNNKQCKVKVKDPYSFEIDIDTSYFSPYERGGYINQIKQPTLLSFHNFDTSLKNPGEFVGDFVKLHYAGALHFAFQALHSFVAKYGELPEAGNSDHAEEVFHCTQLLNTEAAKSHTESSPVFHLSDEELSGHKDLILKLSMCSRGVINPVCAYMGGIMGQEVLKACSGKFMPIKQWFYFDALEALPDEPLPQSEVTPQQCRYDGQIMVFGKKMQEEIGKLNMFLVGAGAIGCEMMKNWAMMGIACNNSNITNNANYPNGKIWVTDMDSIEKSNLSRQFLFRNKDINNSKSVTAANAIKVMNNTINITAMENKVSSETEHIYNDDFYESLSMICTALDNVEARLYIDSKCLFYHLPLLESGTLGAKGHTQVVSPYQTENYGATRDPPEKSIPVCTLKHFPNQIDHTLQWARDWFEEAYKQTPDDVNQYLTEPDYEAVLASQQNMRLDTLNRVRDSLVSNRPKTFDDCIVWARHCFEDLFANKVKQLLHNFPLDRKTPSGTPFWSGAKRPPTPLQFSCTDTLHAEFILSAAVLRAKIFNIACPSQQEIDSANYALEIARKATTVTVQQFRPQDGVKIAATDEEMKANEAEHKSNSDNLTGTDIDVQCNNIIKSLPTPATSAHLSMTSIEFDKDIDSHMRVVAAVSNLRARNYSIPEADLHTSRGIAGKITPAIATTTAMVTGAICLEIYKLLQKKPITKLMNTFANLALPLFTSMEPEPPKMTVANIKGSEWKWNQWDRIDITDSNMTIDGLINKLETDYNVELSMLSTGVTILYSDFMDRKKMKERKNMTLKQVVETVTKKEIPSSQKYLIFELIVMDIESGDEVEIPYLRFKLF